MGSFPDCQGWQGAVDGLWVEYHFCVCGTTLQTNDWMTSPTLAGSQRHLTHTPATRVIAIVLHGLPASSEGQFPLWTPPRYPCGPLQLPQLGISVYSLVYCEPWTLIILLYCTHGLIADLSSS